MLAAAQGVCLSVLLVSQSSLSRTIDKRKMRVLYHLPALAALTAATTVDYSQYVNPFIGSSGPIPGLAFGGGDIFLGAALPFGVAKVGIDTYEKNVSFSTINGGYTPQGLVTAISMMHESGTGGSAKYGIVGQMPLATLEGVNVLDNRTYWQKRVGRDVASVGYFETKFESGVDVKLSAGRHTGIMEYAFPKGEGHVLVDVSHYLPAEGGGGDSQFFAGGQIKVKGDGKTYTGYGSYGGGFSESAPMTTYFCGEFETAPDEARTFRGKNTDSMVWPSCVRMADNQQLMVKYRDFTATTAPAQAQYPSQPSATRPKHPVPLRSVSEHCFHGQVRIRQPSGLEWASP